MAFSSDPSPLHVVRNMPCMTLKGCNVRSLSVQLLRIAPKARGPSLNPVTAPLLHDHNKLQAYETPRDHSYPFYPLSVGYVLRSIHFHLLCKRGTSYGLEIA